MAQEYRGDVLLTANRLRERAGITGGREPAERGVRTGPLEQLEARLTGEQLFGTLLAAPRRLGAPRVPVPYAEPLEAMCRVSEEQIVATATQMLA